MNDELVLLLSYVVIAPAWLALLVAPRWRPTQVLSGTVAVSLLLAGVYLALVLFRGGSNPEAGVWTMDALVALFADRRVVLIGWVHYLSFDLFVGCWMAAHAAHDDVSRWLVGPCLLLVLVMGPIGLLTYFALRLGLRKGWRVFSTPLPSAASAKPLP